MVCSHWSKDKIPGSQQALVILKLASLAVEVGHAVANPHSVFYHAKSVVAASIFITKLYLDFATFAGEPCEYNNLLSLVFTWSSSSSIKRKKQ